MGTNEMPAGIPSELELKKTRIVCPACGEGIEVDMTIDISSITDLIGAFGQMGQVAEPEDEGNAGN